VLEKGMVVKGTVRSIKPYGLLIQVEQVCEHLDGSMPRFTAEFNRIHELDLKVAPTIRAKTKRGRKSMSSLGPACLYRRPCAT
jgi:ribosomal protein S1